MEQRETGEGEWEGANMQQSQRESDKDGADSRTTAGWSVTSGRLTCQIRQSDTNVTTLTFHALALSLFITSFSLLPSRSEASLAPTPKWAAPTPSRKRQQPLSPS